jgi:hypothetical protein
MRLEPGQALQPILAGEAGYYSIAMFSNALNQSRCDPWINRPVWPVRHEIDPAAFFLIHRSNVLFRKEDVDAEPSSA